MDVTPSSLELYPFADAMRRALVEYSRATGRPRPAEMVPVTARWDGPDRVVVTIDLPAKSDEAPQ